MTYDHAGLYEARFKGVTVFVAEEDVIVDNYSLNISTKAIKNLCLYVEDALVVAQKIAYSERRDLCFLDVLKKWSDEE